MTNYYGTSVAAVQGAFLEGLGIYRKGYAPEGAVGRGRIVYDNVALQYRLSYAGFNGGTIHTWFTGKVAMTVRTLYAVSQAALGDVDDRQPVIAMKVLARKVERE